MAEMQDLENESLGELETVNQEIEQRQQVEDVPEKYRGKSVQDVIRMHEEAEKLISRQGQEVGDLRKLADDFLRSQLTQAKVSEPEKPKEIDFFENPQAAIQSAIEQNPKVRAAEQYAQQMQMEQARMRLNQRHPDAAGVVQDPDFQQWVRASAVRQRLFQQADAFDADAADELLSTYKEIKTLKTQRVKEIDTSSREKAMKSASVDAGGTGESGQKMYRRADLIRLKMRDPSKYESMQDEIMAAYSEGRVK
jgi:hypothetical protein